MTRTSRLVGFFASILVSACNSEADPGSSHTTSGASTSSAEQGHEATGVPTTDPGSASTTAAMDPGDTTTTATTGTASEATAGMTGTTTTASTTATTRETPCGDCGFICDDECNEMDPVQCDVFAQDCPEGEKCAAYAEGGAGSWNATKCVPVTGEKAVGDACTAEGGGTSGLDDCQTGAMCWNVDGEGAWLCVELCAGTQAAPTCANEAGFNCAVIDEGVLNICLPGCDPLVQDCAGDDVCIPVADTFVCVFDDSGEGGQTFDTCEFLNGCDKGLYCLHPSAATECDPNFGGCCMPLCDLSNPDVVCPGVGTICMSLYAEGEAPPEFESVGICVVPG